MNDLQQIEATAPDAKEFQPVPRAGTGTPEPSANSDRYALLHAGDRLYRAKSSAKRPTRGRAGTEGNYVQLIVPWISTSPAGVCP
jgi:hypothetical protein